MISNRAASIPRAGIMFATTGDPDRPFPSLPDLSGDHGTPGAHEHLSPSFPIEDFPGWMLVSVDPTRFMYYDDDNEAMDLSNWAVIMGAVGDYASEINYGSAPGRQAEYWQRNVRDAYDEGAFLVDRVLLVAPIVGEGGSCGAWAPATFAGDSPYSCDLPLDHEGDHEHHEDDDTIRSWEDDEAWVAHVDRVRALVDLADSLEGYPLLDESDYCEREHEAWCEWADRGGLQHDTIRAMNEDEWDESLVNAIDEAWSDVWPIASRHLDEQRGFTGECSPDFHEAIARAIDAGELNHVLVGINEASHDDEDEAPTSEDEDERGSSWFDTAPGAGRGINADDF